MPTEDSGKASEYVSNCEEDEQSPMDSMIITSLQGEIVEMKTEMDARVSGIEHSITVMNIFQEAMQANIAQILDHLCHHSSFSGLPNP